MSRTRPFLIRVGTCTSAQRFWSHRRQYNLGTSHKAHIPTKRLSFESIVRFAITELKVRPQQATWETTLDASEAAFEEHKTE